MRMQTIEWWAKEMQITAGPVHGFVSGRSPATNALQHLSFSYTLSMDLSDFFDSVTPEMLPEVLRFMECFPDGAARQGLPTSPALANLAARPMDAEILSMLPNPNALIERMFSLFDTDTRVVYTRYADDLCFSSNTFSYLKSLPPKIEAIAKRHGFTVNKAKTRMQWAGAGRRMITGVAVDSKLHTPRHIKRRIRAATHQKHTAELRGLLEWAKLKIPTKFNQELWSNKPIAKAVKAVAKAVASATTEVKQSFERVFQFD